jgi:hypothetical protein
MSTHKSQIAADRDTVFAYIAGLMAGGIAASSPPSTRKGDSK